MFWYSIGELIESRGCTRQCVARVSIDSGKAAPKLPCAEVVHKEVMKTPWFSFPLAHTVYAHTAIVQHYLKNSENTIQSEHFLISINVAFELFANTKWSHSLKKSQSANIKGNQICVGSMNSKLVTLLCGYAWLQSNTVVFQFLLMPQTFPSRTDKQRLIEDRR